MHLYSSPCFAFITLSWSAAAFGLPVFSDVSARLGSDAMVVLADSDSPNAYYILPRQLGDRDFFPDSAQLPTQANLHRTHLQSGLTRFSITVEPKLSRAESIAFSRAMQSNLAGNREFKILPLNCYNLSMSLNGVPSHLISSTATYALSPPAGLEVALNYAYRIDLDTDQPELLLNVINSIGVKGSLNLQCLGFRGDDLVHRAATSIVHSIRVDERINGVDDDAP